MKKILLGTVGLLWCSLPAIAASDIVPVFARLDLDYGIQTTFYDAHRDKWLPVMISPDWNVIASASGLSSSSFKLRAVRWTRESGLVDLGQAGDVDAVPSLMTSDGATIIGQLLYSGSANQSFIWTEDGGLRSFNGPSNSSTLIHTLSDDGKNFYGSTTNSSGRTAVFRFSNGTMEYSGEQQTKLRPEILSVSSDQKTVIYGSYEQNAARVYRWSPEGTSEIGHLNGDNTFSTEIFNQGDLIFGISYIDSTNYVGFRWTPTDGIQQLVPTGTCISSSPGVFSKDGKQLVGSMDTTRGTRVFRWSESDGFKDSGNTLDGDIIGNQVVGPDLTVYGTYNKSGSCEAFRWGKSGDVALLGLKAKYSLNWAEVNQAGTRGLLEMRNDDHSLTDLLLYREGLVNISIGRVEDLQPYLRFADIEHSRFVLHTVPGGSSANLRSYMWTETGGFSSIGNLEGATYVEVTQATSDLNFLAGVYGVGDQRQAFIWDPSNGMQDLKAVLLSTGFDLTGWGDISTVDYMEVIDGVPHIIGSGYYNGGPQNSTPPCPSLFQSRASLWGLVSCSAGKGDTGSKELECGRTVLPHSNFFESGD